MAGWEWGGRSGKRQLDELLTDMQRPTHRETEKLRDREAGGVGRGGGAGGVQRETARDELRGPGRPGWEKLIPNQGDSPTPTPPRVPAPDATRARARTHATLAALPGPPTSGGARAPPGPPPAAGASRTRRRRSPCSPAPPPPLLPPRRAGARGRGRGPRCPALLRPLGPAQAPDAAAATAAGAARAAGGGRLGRGHAHPLRRPGAGARPELAAARSRGCPSWIPHPGALRRLWAAPAGKGVPGPPGRSHRSLASDPSLLGSLSHAH